MFKALLIVCFLNSPCIAIKDDEGIFKNPNHGWFPTTETCQIRTEQFKIGFERSRHIFESSGLIVSSIAEVCTMITEKGRDS